MAERAGLSTAELLLPNFPCPLLARISVSLVTSVTVLEVVTNVMSVVSKALSVAIA